MTLAIKKCASISAGRKILNDYSMYVVATKMQRIFLINASLLIFFAILCGKKQIILIVYDAFLMVLFVFVQLVTKTFWVVYKGPLTIKRRNILDTRVNDLSILFCFKE